MADKEEVSKKRDARKKLDKKKFNRQNAGKYNRFKNKDRTWRKPRGRHSKLRKEEGENQKVKVGRRKPQELRGIHPSGREEVLVHNPQKLADIDSATEAARIAAKVGQRKREEIEKKAEENDIKLLN